MPSKRKTDVERPRVGVYVCHCGTNIAGIVDVEGIVEACSKLPHVVMARSYKYLCSEPGQKLIKEDIRSERLDRVVVASCTPRMHEQTFRRALAAAGLNPFYLEVANIREHVSWVVEDKSKATAKALRLVRAAVSRVAHHAALEPRKEPVTRAALVVGGGIAGIQAALSVADAGYPVYLVEREPTIGGHMAQLDKTFPTLDCGT